MNNLAVLLRRRGELAAAEAMFREALDIQRRVLGPVHTEVASTMNNLASLLNAMDRGPEAIDLARRALDVRRQLNAGDHPQTAISLTNLGQWLGEAGEIAEADEKLREALAMRERLFSGDHPELALNRMVLANHLVETGRAAEGCGLGAGSAATLAAAYGESNWRVAVAWGLEGACLHAGGLHEESEAQLLASLEGLETDVGLMTARRQTLRRLVRLYEDWDRPQEAARYQQLLATVGAAR
jgi:tetratricopeptide (TPR) repeat protein